MPRPSVTGMFNSTIRIWRPAAVLDALAVEERVYAEVDVVGAAINRSSTPEAQAGGGLSPTGTIRWYGEASIDILPRDVCQVLTGPDAGRTWEVNQFPTRPRGHHTQVDCVAWSGVLPLEVIS